MSCPDCNGTRRTFWAQAGMMQDCQTCCGAVPTAPPTPGPSQHLGALDLMLLGQDMQEIRYCGYAPVRLPLDLGTWRVVGDLLVNLHMISFPQMVAGAQVSIYGYGACDQSGQMSDKATIVHPMYISPWVSPVFASGSLLLQNTWGLSTKRPT